MSQAGALRKSGALGQLGCSRRAARFRKAAPIRSRRRCFVPLRSTSHSLQNRLRTVQGHGRQFLERFQCSSLAPSCGSTRNMAVLNSGHRLCSQTQALTRANRRFQSRFRNGCNLILRIRQDRAYEDRRATDLKQSRILDLFSGYPNL